MRIRNLCVGASAREMKVCVSRKSGMRISYRALFFALAGGAGGSGSSRLSSISTSLVFRVRRRTAVKTVATSGARGLSAVYELCTTVLSLVNITWKPVSVAASDGHDSLSGPSILLTYSFLSASRLEGTSAGSDMVPMRSRNTETK